jgi:hypothetical protein
MKKILLLSAIVFTTLSSCKKEEMPTTELDPSLKPVAIQVNVDNYTGEYVRVY